MTAIPRRPFPPVSVQQFRLLIISFPKAIQSAYTALLEWKHNTTQAVSCGCTVYTSRDLAARCTHHVT